MKNSIKKKFIKGFLILVIGFVLFFLFRFIYGFISYPNSQSNMSLRNNVQTSINNIGFDVDIKNYATKKMKTSSKPRYDDDADISGTGSKLEQKYEKVASLSSKTKNFDNDEKKLRDTIKNYEALIQYEQKNGIYPYRTLNISIGVNPDKFTEMKDSLKDIGEITAITINQTDKTNEYKSLNAKKTSLINTKESLVALKDKGGSIEELILLENRILDIESQIQTLGVNLGEYDKENEFCTIRFSLTEKFDREQTIPLMQRVKVALEWSIQYYAIFIFILFFISLSVLIIIKILEKLKWIPSAIEKTDDKDNNE